MTAEVLKMPKLHIGSLAIPVDTAPPPFSLNRMHRTKLNLIRRIMCLINLMFNIQAAAPPGIFIKDVLRGMLMGHDVINT